MLINGVFDDTFVLGCFNLSLLLFTRTLLVATPSGANPGAGDGARNVFSSNSTGLSVRGILLLLEVRAVAEYDTYVEVLPD